MAYSVINFKTKKELKEAVKKWQIGEGRPVEAYQPGGMFPLKLGTNVIEGPHYPEAHRWYASVMIEELNGLNIITKVTG